MHIAEAARRYGDQAGRRWYVGGMLFPAYLAAILLGLFAALGAWWLWPVAALLGVSSTVVVVTAAGRERNGAETPWHLR